MQIKSANEFVELLLSEDPEQYRRAAEDTAEEEVWREVLHQFPEKRKWVVHNKTVPLSILRTMIYDEDPDIRITIAMTRRIDIEMMEQLATDTDPRVRQRIAYNKKTPPNIIEKLSTDPDDIVSTVARSRLGRR